MENRLEISNVSTMYVAKYISTMYFQSNAVKNWPGNHLNLWDPSFTYSWSIQLGQKPHFGS